MDFESFGRKLQIVRWRQSEGGGNGNGQSRGVETAERFVVGCGLEKCRDSVDRSGRQAGDGEQHQRQRKRS